MRWFLQAVVGAAFFACSGLAFAQDLIPERRFVMTLDQELPGGGVG